MNNKLDGPFRTVTVSGEHILLLFMKQQIYVKIMKAMWSDPLLSYMLNSQVIFMINPVQTSEIIINPFIVRKILLNLISV